MSRHLSLGVLAALLLTVFASAEDKKAPEDLVKEKNLQKVGAFYLLEGDVKLGDDLKQMRLAKKTLDDDTRKRIDVEKKIKMAKGALADWEYEYRELNEKLGATKDALQHNQIVGQINSLVSKLKEGTQFKTEREAELAKLGSSRDAYVNIIVELADKMEKLAAQYDELNKDEPLKNALVVINDKARPKMKLGPSAEFTGNIAFVKMERGKINSSIIKVVAEGNVPHVEVTLNGTMTRSMVLDSGASFVALTADTAKALNLVPGPKDPPLRLQMADGKLVTAHQMMLKSVRVGQFIVENVECAVLPENLVAAENLLGGTFLRNFVYKLDPTAGELHMSQIGGKVAKENPLDKKPGGEAPPKKPDTPAGGNPLDGGGKKPGSDNPLDK